jgi:glycosyltransferase involved in cell wall biosynthesis
VVGSAADILFDAYFNDSDFVIYHFGVYYELFNAILLGNGRATQIAYYHNVTPKQFMPASAHTTIEKSLRQRANIGAADEVWAVSEVNKADLVRFGIPDERIAIMPLYVKPRFARLSHSGKARDRVRVLYVGRFVASKGVTDLVRAIGMARALTPTRFTVDLVGNLQFSDPLYVAEVKKLITQLELEDVVSFVGEVDDNEVAERLSAAHVFAIASFHEGFCVSLVEALQAGCVPIAYAAGNVPELIGPLGELVALGDWRALAAQLARYIEFFGRQRAQEGGRKAQLPLRGGEIDFETYDRMTKAHLATYTFDAFGDRLSLALIRLRDRCSAAENQ